MLIFRTIFACLLISTLAFAQREIQLPAPSEMLVVQGGSTGGSNDVGTIYYGAVPANHGTKPVLVFIHGYNSSASTWWQNNDMYSKAFADGYRTAFVSVHPDQNMWTNGQLFANMLNTIRNHYGVNKVVVIAHSKGGVDSDAALVHYEAWNRVERVITLGSPHWGTPLADLASSGWTSWLGAIFGQNNNATKSLQTGNMANFRALTDNHANRPKTNFRTFGGWDYYGSLWISGVYLSSKGGAKNNTDCGNDGVVNYKSTRRPNSSVIFACLDSRGKIHHFDIAKGTPMWNHIKLQLPSSLTREIDNSKMDTEKYNPFAVIQSSGEFLSADQGKRSVTIHNASKVRIRVYQENGFAIRISTSGNVEANIDNVYNDSESNVKIYDFEQYSPSATYELSSDKPYFAVVETDRNITATLHTDLSNEKFTYKEGEDMNFFVHLEGDEIESVSGSLMKTLNIDGSDDNSQISSTLKFIKKNGQFTAQQRGTLPAGVYNVAIQVKGKEVTRSIVTSIAIVPSEKGVQVENNLDGLVAYPNPVVSDKAQIHFEIQKKGIHFLNIYDFTGKKVYSENLSHLDVGKHEITWQADASLPNGIYIYELISNDKKTAKRLVLKR